MSYPEQNHNELSDAETERLAILAEECGEVIQIVGKILRHGYQSMNPNNGEVNRLALERELGDINYITTLMLREEDIEIKSIREYSAEKAERIKQYLHHQIIPAVIKPNTVIDDDIPF